MTKPPEFKSFKEAETTIKQQVLSLCEQYTSAIEQIRPILKKSATEPAVIKSDQKIFLDLYNEANDHIHNLAQLTKELTETKTSNPNLIFEVGSEVLSNTVNFLNSLPSAIQKTIFYTNN